MTMWPSAGVLLLLSVALVQEGTARSTLDFLRELKNRIFIPDNAPKPTQKPYPECSDLDEENGTCLPQNTTLDETFSSNETTSTLPMESYITSETENGQQNQVNTTETFGNGTYRETERWETNMTDLQEEYIGNNTQNYDEQDWTDTSGNGTQRDTEYEPEYDENTQNETTNINNESTIQQNVETIEETNNERMKRDLENKTFKSDMISNKYSLNTTVFIGGTANSTTNEIGNHINNTIIEKVVLDSSNTTSSQNMSAFSNNDSTTGFNSNLTDVNNMNDETDNAFENKDNGDDKIYFAANKTEMVLGNTHFYTNITSDQQNSDFTFIKGSSLEDSVYSNTSEHLEGSNQLNQTEFKVINSIDMETTDTDTDTNMENSTASQIGIAMNETKDDTPKFDANNTSINILTVSGKDPNTVQLSTKSINNDEENGIINDKNTNEIPKQRLDLEKLLINSTQLLENFFQNITQELPTLGSEMLNVISSGREVRWPLEENENTPINATSETVIESNVTVDLNDQTAMENNNTNVSDTESGRNIPTDETLDALNVENNVSLANSRPKELNTTDIKFPSQSVTLENTTTELLKDSNETTEANKTSESVTRKKRSITLTFGMGEEDEVTTVSTNETEELTFNSSDSGSWNETSPIASDIGCCSQNETCTNSSECCEQFVCVAPDGTNLTSYCDFRPLDPDLSTPLPSTGNNKETQP